MPSADDRLNLPLWVGQRTETFRFRVVHGPTGRVKGWLNPERDSPPSLSHDGTSTVSRRVSGLVLPAKDVGLLDPLADRIEISMVVGAGRTATTYPLGRYMVEDTTELVSTGGQTTPITLKDEMLIVDQELEAGFDAGRQPVDQAILRLLDGLPIGEPEVDATDQTAANAWSAGSSRASALNELATVGGYFKPWFNHQGRLKLRRAFEPADMLATIDLDDPPRVARDSISRQSGLPGAPNRFVVVSNDLDEQTAPVVGVYDVPASAPHSILRRGFVVPKVEEAQVRTRSQAQVYARTLGIQRAVYEQVELATPVDPRHDGWDVVRWDRVLWLETGWSMQLVAGGDMQHTLRRAYPRASEE